MNILSPEVIRPILQQLDLDSLVSLRQVNRFYYQCIDSFDDDLIREKVMERAPWFHERAGFDSWNACARVLLSRTKACLAAKDPKTDWNLIGTDLSVHEIKVEPETTLVDPVDFKDFKPGSKLVFPDEVLRAPGYCASKGSKLLVRGLECDLVTKMAQFNGYCPDDDYQYSDKVCPYSKPEVTSPSGLRVRYKDGVQRVQVVDENDKLLLIRVQTEEDEEEDWDLPSDVEDEGPDMFTYVMTDANFLVYKDTCPRDDDGVLIIDMQKLVEIDMDEPYGKAFFKLLPGAAGALVTKLFHSRHKSYLGYISPTEELRHTVITFLPSLRHTRCIEYSDAKPRDFLLYNGFLYYSFEGRIFRLWVDLGVGRPLKRSDVLCHDMLPQKNDTQCLSAYHPLFPALGTFSERSVRFQMHILVQGSKENGMDRYVTEDRTCGYVVGDLKTGRTWKVNHFTLVQHLMIPYLEDDKIKFYKVDRYVCKELKEKLHTECRYGEPPGDFPETITALINNTDKHEKPDSRKIIARPLFYDYSGEVSPALFGPYLKKRPIFGKSPFGHPSDYDTMEHVLDKLPEVDGTSGEWDSDKEYEAACNRGENVFGRDMTLARESTHWPEIYAMYAKLEQLCGSTETNDPSDPQNIAARARFAKGAFHGAKRSPLQYGDRAYEMGYNLGRVDPGRAEQVLLMENAGLFY